jgi:hypothetical protein
MAVPALEKSVRAPWPPGPELRLIEARRRGARLHLLTYVVGNAFFWVLWSAVSVSADHWYWWATVPLAGWTLVLGLHLWNAYRRSG